MIYFYLECDALDNDIRSLFMAFYPGRAIKRIETKEYACAEGDLFLRVCMSDCAETQCLANEDNTKKKMTMELMQDGTLLEDACECELSDRKDTKTKAKCMLYCLLSKLTKKELPWGTLTGIRPTKIARSMLMEGASDEECIDYMKNQMLCGEEKTMLSLDIAKREIKLLDCLDYEDGYSLYVGIPFCPTNCLYCSFPSYPCDRFGHLRDDYVAALQREIKGTAKLMQGKRLTSVYMGGGTPTTLSPEQLRTVIKTMQEYFPMDTSVEFTVEAGRPDSITEDKLLALRECGVDRISVNPQTMQQKTLDLIGRRHTVDQTIQAFELARKLGFTNINMDLIIGLPGEELSDFEDTLRQVGQLAPDSLTIHSLVIKRASRLRSVLEEQGALGETEQIRGRRMEQMLACGEQFAREQGYLPYYMYRQKNKAGTTRNTNQENVAYAKPGKECLYNTLIMEEWETIAALGSGGSTKYVIHEENRMERIENVKSVDDYILRIDEMIERKKK